MTDTQTSLKPMASLDLGNEDLLDIYYKMVLSRTLDERLWLLHRQGKIHFHISAMGHEALQAAMAGLPNFERLEARGQAKVRELRSRLGL